MDRSAHFICRGCGIGARKDGAGGFVTVPNPIRIRGGATGPLPPNWIFLVAIEEPVCSQRCALTCRSLEIG